MGAAILIQPSLAQASSAWTPARVSRDGAAARALEFLIVTATRTSETPNVTWNAFDLESEVWTILAIGMKAKVEHRVPLFPGLLRS